MFHDKKLIDWCTITSKDYRQEKGNIFSDMYTNSENMSHKARIGGIL